jgi:hypothetical protein
MIIIVSNTMGMAHLKIIDVEVKVGYLIHYLNLPSVSTIKRQKAQQMMPGDSHNTNCNWWGMRRHTEGRWLLDC